MSEQYPWLVVGAKVTPIGPTWSVGPGDEDIPAFGSVYTVREVDVICDEVAIRLVEIVNPQKRYTHGLMECFFPASSFAPVTSNDGEAGLSILKKIVADVFQTDGVNV
jgi:hypothetical protein